MRVRDNFCWLPYRGKVLKDYLDSDFQFINPWWHDKQPKHASFEGNDSDMTFFFFIRAWWI
jgi:hypothetical protein